MMDMEELGWRSNVRVSSGIEKRCVREPRVEQRESRGDIPLGVGEKEERN